jgi:hypothetical protein
MLKMEKRNGELKFTKIQVRDIDPKDISVRLSDIIDIIEKNQSSARALDFAEPEHRSWLIKKIFEKGFYDPGI